MRAALIPAISLCAVLAGAPAAGQQPPKMARIGMLNAYPADHAEGRAAIDVFRQALTRLGYIEGGNVSFEYRWGDGRLDQLPALAVELVRQKVDIIVVGPTPSALAAKQATATIPIVAWAMQDPVRDGLVASLARPGGNVTGLTFLGPELVAKRLGLLKEAFPKMSRVAALWHQGGLAEKTEGEMLRDAQARAQSLGMQLRVIKVEKPARLDAAFADAVKGRAEALLVLPSPMFYTERRRIAELAAKYRLPATYNAREFVEVGGLMSYGASIPDLVRRSAGHVDRILKGAKPTELPVEQPTRYEFVINLSTAKALGLTIPSSVVAQADDAVR